MNVPALSISQRTRKYKVSRNTGHEFEMKHKPIKVTIGSKRKETVKVTIFVRNFNSALRFEHMFVSIDIYFVEKSRCSFSRIVKGDISDPVASANVEFHFNNNVLLLTRRSKDRTTFGNSGQ